MTTQLLAYDPRRRRLAMLAAAPGAASSGPRPSIGGSLTFVPAGTPAARALPTPCLLAFGGSDSAFSRHRDLWAFDLARHTWTPIKPALPPPPAAAAAAAAAETPSYMEHHACVFDAARDRIVLTGGYRDAKGERAAWSFHLRRLAWRRERAPCPVEMMRHTCRLVGDVVYHVGGWARWPGTSTWKPQTGVWAYDLVRETWTTVPLAWPSPAIAATDAAAAASRSSGVLPHSAFAAAPVPGGLLIMGGHADIDGADAAAPRGGPASPKSTTSSAPVSRASQSKSLQLRCLSDAFYLAFPRRPAGAASGAAPPSALAGAASTPLATPSASAAAPSSARLATPGHRGAPAPWSKRPLAPSPSDDSRYTKRTRA
ncbi:hypothetical protein CAUPRSCDRAFT_12238 [Caulochytrium protostelioides]|nr:hypothetical protein CAUPRSCDRAFT_12238 [Caulochytrium protostelioides]